MTTVFVSGCFDLMHGNHVEFLEFASRQGDRLIVSVAADATIRALKREPLLCEYDRCRMVQALRCVDEAFVARGEHSHRDCFSYVRTLRPDVWVIDHDDPHREEKEALAVEVGTEIVLNYRPENGVSTSGLLAKIRGEKG